MKLHVQFDFEVKPELLRDKNDISTIVKTF
jgi:hypothetical protein